MSRRRIYARTLSRSPTDGGDSSDDKSGQESPPSGSGTTDSAPKRNQGAAPMIGTRSTQGDRQVARHSRSRSKTRQIRHLKFLVAFLILSVVALSMGWILEWTKVQRLEAGIQQVDSDLRRTEIELEKVRERLAQRESEVFDLVESRIPGLKEIEYNRLVDVKDRYLLNLTISEAGTEDERELEYHTVLKNETAGIILPRIKIYLFDEYGLQVGMSAVEKRHATSQIDIAELSPGETRSYHSTLTVERGAIPKYYMLHID